MKILLIDDSKSITKVLTTYLEHSDFDVTVANDGKEGLRLIENGDFDKIILDLSMPEFTGLDVLENLKQKNFPGLNKIHVLTATSLSQSEIEELLAYGINSFLRKPLEMPELVQKLRE